jgi:5-methylcytosine-specific restriction enzyme subunit McrC
VIGAADLNLTERRTRLCRLAGDEVRYLVEHHRGAVDLAPTTRRGVWRVSARGVVGVLHTPLRRVVISPKMPISNLLLLLDSAATVEDVDGATSGEAVLRLLAGRLAVLMRERSRVGLHRDYRLRNHEGPVLLGALDVAAQMRQPVERRDRLHGRVDEFTVDVECNQLPRAVAGLVVRSGVLDAPAREQLLQAVAGFADVADLALDSLALRLARMPEPPGYGPLLDLCRVLLGVPGGVGERRSLLVSLERLFERFLCRAAEEAVAGRADLTVQSQAATTIGDPPGLLLRPDFTISRAGRPEIIVDAKWKRLPEDGQIPEDIYQALAYASFLGARRAVLVYPGRRRVVRRFVPATHDVCVEVRTVAVSGSEALCRRERQRLQRGLLRGG